MTHSTTRPPGLLQRALVRALGGVEWCALTFLPRGSLRRSLLQRVDRTFARLHRENCERETRR